MVKTFNNHLYVKVIKYKKPIRIVAMAVLTIGISAILTASPLGKSGEACKTAISSPKLKVVVIDPHDRMDSNMPGSKMCEDKGETYKSPSLPNYKEEILTLALIDSKSGG